jgi:hypothetical protein
VTALTWSSLSPTLAARVRERLGPDVMINGTGFYSITPLSPEGTRWMKRHLSKGERTRDERTGTIYSDDGNAVREITAAIDRAGLRVEVNGTDMKGYAALHERVG